MLKCLGSGFFFFFPCLLLCDDAILWKLLIARAGSDTWIISIFASPVAQQKQTHGVGEHGGPAPTLAALQGCDCRSSSPVLWVPLGTMMYIQDYILQEQLSISTKRTAA